jgi:hypothetical protein
MNEEKTELWLHKRGHLWHMYFITVNKVMVETVKPSKWWFQLYQYVSLAQ